MVMKQGNSSKENSNIFIEKNTNEGAGSLTFRDVT